MNQIDNVMRSMKFDFFGNSRHKVAGAQHLSTPNSIFLDVRSNEEFETLSFNLKHHIPVIHIPIEEIPDRLAEIPLDKNIGIFCSSGTRSSMTYLYLRSKGFEKVKIIEENIAAFANELKPGKILKHIQSK